MRRLYRNTTSAGFFRPFFYKKIAAVLVVLALQKAETQAEPSSDEATDLGLQHQSEYFIFQQLLAKKTESYWTHVTHPYGVFSKPVIK